MQMMSEKLSQKEKWEKQDLTRGGIEGLDTQVNRKSKVDEKAEIAFKILEEW